MDKCKYCGSSELELENKTKFSVMDAPQVALKCAKCGKWLKWCPKDERKYYLGEFKKIAQKSDEIQIAELKHKIELSTNRWEKLKSFIFNRPYCSRIELEVNELRLLNSILEKMEELENGKDINVATIEEISPPPREDKEKAKF